MFAPMNDGLRIKELAVYDKFKLNDMPLFQNFERHITHKL